MGIPGAPGPVSRLRDSLTEAIGYSTEIRAKLASLEAQVTALAEALRKADDENKGLRAELDRFLERADAAAAIDDDLDDGESWRPGEGGVPETAP